LQDKERSLNRVNTDRRRQDYGSSQPASGGSSRTGASGLSSDAERQALLTGDYSFLNTDKGRKRGQGGDDSWKRYLG